MNDKASEKSNSCYYEVKINDRFWIRDLYDDNNARSSVKSHLISSAGET